MKIKAVCELTGLTARTVRVYIDEQLIAPKFTENYLGRRSFEFSQSDIAALQNIATLRKYGFSIDEIRNILLDSQTSIAIIENVKQRTQIQADEYRERLKALSRVESLKAYSVEELSKIKYTDYVGIMMSSITTIINAITYVLIAFVAVSLIVSSIMIGVITLISVQERTKEIGILRAIGASKRNVSTMFNAETVIIGFTSGALGVLITYLLLIPINLILHSLTGIQNLNAILL